MQGIIPTFHEPRIWSKRQLIPQVLSRFGDVLPSQLLIATDFDGTLAPIVSEPGGAAAQPGSLTHLERLVRVGVRLAVISGRSQEDLRRRVPVAGAHIVGDCGLGEPTRHERKQLDRFNSVAGKLTSRMRGVWLEVKPGSTSVQYRLAPDSGPDLAASLMPIAQQLGLSAWAGRLVLEVAPARARKANAISDLLASIRPRAIVYVGDDECDRTAFELVSSLPIRHLVVGVESPEVPTSLFKCCDLIVSGPEGVEELLVGLHEWAFRRRG